MDAPIGRPLVCLISTVLLVSVSAAQSLTPRASTIQYVNVAVSGPTEAVAPGGAVELFLNIAPKPKIHVYAAGAKGFTPVSLVVSPVQGVTAAKPKYPAAELLGSPGLDTPVPVYAKPFAIIQPVTISRTAKSGDVLNISGTFNYESCNDVMCFPVLSIPVGWTVKVR